MAEELTQSKTKQERIYFRLDAEAKRILAQAAEYTNETTSAFIRRIVMETANRIIHEKKVLELSPKDSAAFLDALDNPPLPNDALRQAAAKYVDSMQA